MGLFGKWFGTTMDREAFTEAMREAFASQGVVITESNVDEFGLKTDSGVRVFLGNVYNDYLNADKADRARVIQNFAQSLSAPSVADMPWAEAKTQVFPLVRSHYAFALMKLKGIGESLEIKGRPLVGSVGQYLALDLPTSVQMFGSETIGKWDVSPETVWEHAHQNLRAKTEGLPFDQLAEGIYLGTSPDENNPSRLLMPELFHRLELNGDPVVYVPANDTLFVTGANDDGGLEAIANASYERYCEARSLSLEPLVLRDKTWQPFEPPEDHPLYNLIHKTALMDVGSTYTDQQELLDAQGEDVFIASYSMMENPDQGIAAFSYCVWGEGVVTRLPVTDKVMFVRDSGGQGGEPLGFAHWASVKRVLGSQMTLVPDLLPVRFHVESFPTQEELEAMDLDTMGFK